jgi:hypothetical protein
MQPLYGHLSHNMTWRAAITVMTGKRGWTVVS